MFFIKKKLILLLTSHKKLTNRQSVTILWRKEKKIPWFFPGLYSSVPRMLSRRTSTRLRYTVIPLDSFTLFTPGSRGYFFSYRYSWFAAKRTSREPYQTVSTVYFILGILWTDLWSQGIPCSVLSAKNNLELRHNRIPQTTRTFIEWTLYYTYLLQLISLVVFYSV